MNHRASRITLCVAMAAMWGCAGFDPDSFVLEPGHGQGAPVQFELDRESVLFSLGDIHVRREFRIGNHPQHFEHSEKIRLLQTTASVDGDELKHAPFREFAASGAAPGFDTYHFEIDGRDLDLSGFRGHDVNRRVSGANDTLFVRDVVDGLRIPKGSLRVFALEDSNDVGEDVAVWGNQEFIFSRSDIAGEVERVVGREIRGAGSSPPTLAESDTVSLPPVSGGNRAIFYFKKRPERLMNQQYTRASFLTFGVLNLFGFPYMKDTWTVEIEAVLVDDRGRETGQFSATGSRTEFVAAYWGKSTDGAAKSCLTGAALDAIGKIRTQIATLPDDN